MENNKLNISLKHFNPSTIRFYDYILKERSDPNSTITKEIRIPDANELFRIIDNEFDELRKPSTLAGILKILRLTIQQASTSTANFTTFMKVLLANHCANEEDHLIATQILYQILHSLPEDFPVHKFNISGLIAELFKSNRTLNEKLQTQYALCSALLIEKFEINFMAETIWAEILKSKSHSVLVHNIDSLITKIRIYERANFWRLIESLLSSESRDDRKLGTFLIRKVLKFLSVTPTVSEVDELFHWSKGYSNQLLTSWLTYLTILENLEEKQSHLILPSLEMLNTVALGERTPWIRIAVVQMLRHSNNLVLRWSVDYVFRNFEELVLDNQILQEFFQATNRTWLYNEESSENFKLPLLSLKEQNQFLEELTKVPWKSVPMHAWLLRMKAVQWSGVECKLIIDIATRLRQLQSRSIRSDCREIFASIFESNIDAMSLRDFMNFLDAFYSCTDHLTPELINQLIMKFETGQRPFISFNVCMILKAQGLFPDDELTLMYAFDKLRVQEHKWFRILVGFGFNSEYQQHFCKKHYGITINWTDRPKQSLDQTLAEYVQKLSWDDISKAVVREATVDWFTANSKINESDYEYILDAGGLSGLLRIASPHGRTFPMTPEVLDRLITELRISVKKMIYPCSLISNLINSCNTDQPKLLYKYVNQILDIDVTNNRLALKVFSSALNLCNYHEEEGRKLLIRGLLFGEPLTGDLRHELEYVIRKKLSNNLRYESSFEVRQTCLKFMKTLDQTSKELLKADLITQSKSMSIKKPRYFENSNHHRIKLRIAQTLSILNGIPPTWDDYYLFAILNENNQPNVTYIYEFLVAMAISEAELITLIESLKDLPTSSQVSVFAISYLFTVYHDISIMLVEKLVALLLPWTMGSNFNTRLYAQITIYHLLPQFHLNNYDYLKISIEKSLKDSPSAYEKLISDPRYNMPATLSLLYTDPIVYVTIVPEDEHPSAQLEYLSCYESLKAARNLNISKRNAAKKQDSDSPSKPIIEDVQRKMVPETRLNNGHVSNAEVNNEMIVVASLIDKLPNLGGIARTCEVLGITNLVLDSAKHAQSKEFKNLSMTAENWINIFEVKPSGLKEFLVQKKIDEYSIVGAEQTAKSVNFMEFKFPRKCVLLLGHEKEGIPADLISLLDYAVEIPQCGQVRSLNVHVAGALFMYEYCKQHLLKPKAI